MKNSKVYRIVDREYDYLVLVHIPVVGAEWFTMRCPNLAVLRRAVRNVRRLGFVREVVS